MSKFILCCDLHVRNTSHGINVLPHYLKLMEEITSLAEEHGAQVIMAGDLWHEKHGVSTEVLLGIYRELANAKKAGIVWHLLRGNHEISVKSKPHQTLLTLFQSVARVYVQPAQFTAGSMNLVLMPWYLADEYNKRLKDICNDLQGRYRNVLISHIGLAEGQLSPSNYYRLPQGVKLSNLQPEKWKLVFLGDYHLTQMLDKHVFYGGAPIQHAFGDAPDQGVWLLDGTGPRIKVDRLALQGAYPRYITEQIHPNEPFTSVIEPQNFYRFKVYYDDVPRVETLVGHKSNVFIETLGAPMPDMTKRRLEQVNVADPKAVLAGYMDLIGAGPELRLLAEKHLRQAMEASYGK